MSEIRFASYQPGDEKHILELFSKCFPGRQMDPQYWDWRFRKNPAGDIQIQLAWSNDELVGHYAVSPVVLSIHGADHLTALSLTTMTHPAQRGAGLFRLLGNQLYENLAHSCYVIAWGFPNDMIHHARVRNLHWRAIYEIPMFTLDLERLKTSHGSDCVQELYQFGPEFDDLWTQAKQSYGILTKRDQKYLKWRFKDNPIVHYRILGYSMNGAMQGYLVFSIYRGEHLQIVDMLTVPDPSIALELVWAVINISKDINMKVVTMWLPVHQRVHQELERIGFANIGPITYLGARALDLDNQHEDIWDARRWHYSMSDSDNF